MIIASPIECPTCPRCRSASTQPLRVLGNMGDTVRGRYACKTCNRYFGPFNPIERGGTGEIEDDVLLVCGEKRAGVTEGSVCESLHDLWRPVDVASAISRLLGKQLLRQEAARFIVTNPREMAKRAKRGRR